MLDCERMRSAKAEGALRVRSAETRERRREGEDRECGRGLVPVCACWSGGVFKRPQDGMKERKEQVQRLDRKRRTVRVFAVRAEDTIMAADRQQRGAKVGSPVDLPCRPARRIEDERPHRADLLGRPAQLEATSCRGSPAARARYGSAQGELGRSRLVKG